MTAPSASGSPLPHHRTLAGLAGMVVLVGMGEHMAERFLPLYLERLAQGTTAVLAIGLLAGLDDLLSALYSFPGGYLSDRLGSKRALLVFNGLSIAGYLCVLLIHTWWAVLLGAALFISWSAISLPATMELLARVVPNHRRTLGVSALALVRRVPKLLGPVIGGACIATWGVEHGVRAAFVGALLLALVAVWIQQRWLEDTPGSGIRETGSPLQVWRETGSGFRNLLVADILVRFCERIPDAFVILWATRVIATPVSEWTFGWLSALEQLTAMVIYLPVALLADRHGKRPFVLATFGFFTLFPIVLFGARTPALLMGAFVIRGLKEFGEPTRKALIMDLAPDGRKAAHFGLYYLMRDVIVSMAAFGGALLWAVSPGLNLAVAFGFGLAGTAWFAWSWRSFEPGGHDGH